VEEDLTTRVAQRISGTSKKSFGMYEKAATLSASGKDLIHFELGRPYADTPDHIKQATISALLGGQVHYSDMRGLEKLRLALADKLNTKNRLAVSANDILVTNGLTHASFAAFSTHITRSTWARSNSLEQRWCWRRWMQGTIFHYGLI
jgi:aspartate aminotransferase